jgi:hypothetical protein
MDFERPNVHDISSLKPSFGMVPTRSVYFLDIGSYVTPPQSEIESYVIPPQSEIESYVIPPKSEIESYVTPSQSESKSYVTPLQSEIESEIESQFFVVRPHTVRLTSIDH